MSDTFAVAVSHSIYELMEVPPSLALRQPSLMDLPNSRWQESQTIICLLKSYPHNLQMPNSSSVRGFTKPEVNLQFCRATPHPSRIPWPCRSSRHWPGPAQTRSKRDGGWHWINARDCNKILLSYKKTFNGRKRWYRIYLTTYLVQADHIRMSDELHDGNLALDLPLVQASLCKPGFPVNLHSSTPTPSLIPDGGCTVRDRGSIA